MSGWERLSTPPSGPLLSSIPQELNLPRQTFNSTIKAGKHPLRPYYRHRLISKPFQICQVLFLHLRKAHLTFINSSKYWMHKNILAIPFSQFNLKNKVKFLIEGGTCCRSVLKRRSLQLATACVITGDQPMHTMRRHTCLLND